MDTTYSKEDNQLVITTPSVQKIAIEDLLKNKTDLEVLIQNVQESFNVQLQAFRDNLADINAKIAKAQELDIQPAPVEVAPAPEASEENSSIES